MVIERGRAGYGYREEVAIGRASDGRAIMLSMPKCNYRRDGSVMGRYVFSYRKTDLRPQWTWEATR
jgi:hypothetical protein